MLCSLKIDRTILQGTSPQLGKFLACSLLGDGEKLRRESWLSAMTSLHWRHNDHDGVSNHQPRGCLLNRLFRRRSKKTSKLRITSLCTGKSLVTGEFPAQMTSNAEMFPFDDIIMSRSVSAYHTDIIDDSVQPFFRKAIRGDWRTIHDNKVHGANMGSTWGRQDPGVLHVGHVNLAIWDLFRRAPGCVERHIKDRLHLLGLCLDLDVCTRWQYDYLQSHNKMLSCGLSEVLNVICMQLSVSVSCNYGNM